MKRFRMAVTGLCLFAVACLLAGCSGNPTPKGSGAKPGTTTPKDDHPEEGPHKGLLVEWGEEEYHAEFTADRAKGDVTVYILGKDARTATPIKADKIQLSLKDPAVQIDLTASPQQGDPAGSSSRFVGKLSDSTAGKKLSGTISGAVNGKPYAGDFKEGESPKP